MIHTAVGAGESYVRDHFQCRGIKCNYLSNLHYLRCVTWNRKMERLSHDLNLALEESNCGRPERRKFGLRRRTRSAGNLPAVAVGLVEDGSSSSPPQAPLVTQPLSDSDDPQHNPLKNANLKPRHYCQIGNFESDSFNENFSPTRPSNARRKRKYKKTGADFGDVNRVSPPIEILSTEPYAGQLPIQDQTMSVIHLPKQKTNKPERNAFCGKRKWSHRDRGDGCEMRERSFSGGCSSKSAYFNKSYDFKNKKHDMDKLRKEPILQPGKIVLKSQNVETPCTFSKTHSFPGSSSFNFVYKNSNNNNAPSLSKFPGHCPTTSKCTDFSGLYYKKSKMLNVTHPVLRNPLQFDDGSGMECVGNESSSLSSSDSDGVVANDSDRDREGDDELTDWPGIEELKTFNKSLTFKSSKTVNNGTSMSNMPPPKRLKKEKLLSKGWGNCKNRFKKKRAKVEYSGKDEDEMMSDSKTIVDVIDEVEPKEMLQPDSSFSSFSDLKNARLPSGITNEFCHSFQTFQKKNEEHPIMTPRSNFVLQKTSSSDLNLSEKSPQSDHYFSEHSMGENEVREIRAGCRRVRDERPGFLILCAANEQLSKFLQDSCQIELKLPCVNDPDEKEKLQSLANLYSLDLKVEMDRPVLRKTSNTTQAIRVEHSCQNFPSDHKRRCYGDGTCSSDQESLVSIEEATRNNNVSDCNDFLEISQSLADKSLLDPGDID